MNDSVLTHLQTRNFDASPLAEDGLVKVPMLKGDFAHLDRVYVPLCLRLLHSAEEEEFVTR